MLAYGVCYSGIQMATICYSVFMKTLVSA